MKYFFLLLSILIVHVSSAQIKPDPQVFPHPAETTPNPPKSVNGWTYLNNWTAGGTENSNKDSVSVLVGEYPGQIINFPFSGKAVGIAVYSDGDSGMIEFSVDEADWQTLDLFSLPARLKYFTLESELKGRKHMLQIRMSADKNPNSKGQKCVLRYFVTNN